MRLILFAFTLLATAWTACAQTPLPSPVPAHPRLIVSSADWERLRTQVKADPFSARLSAIMESQARQLLGQPPVERVLEGRRLLTVSRQALERISILATVARVTGNPDYAQRAVAEMLAVSRFSDWHPEHYLDTAEMALAVAIGYDWLYDQIRPEDRAEIETALMDKGIAPSLDPKSPNARWITATNNWNQVCHTGMSAAAIALADLQPDMATRVLNRAIQNVPIAGHAYAPDGVFPEGPMYWNYATSFHILIVAAMERFYGQAQGLDTLPGFPQTPVFIKEMAGPSGTMFNFSDAREGREFGVSLFWFARRYRHAEWLDLAEVDRQLQRYEASTGQVRVLYRLLPFVLIWRDPTLTPSGDASALPLQWMGRGANSVGIHRSAFEPGASFVAIKGGGPSVSHGHMDAGAFVLEADGVRWALDLGMEDYNRLEQMKVNLWNNAQDGQRWDLFRLGPDGHNILRFNSAKQNVKGNAPIVRFQSQGAQGQTVLDLTSLYPQVTSAHRGVRLLPSRAILFQDEWTAADQPVDAGWQWVTRAQVSVQPGAVELKQEGQTLTLRILEPVDAQVEVKTAQELQHPNDADNPGVSRIVLKTHTAAQASGAFRILAIPGSCAQAEAPAKESLLSWPAALKQ